MKDEIISNAVIDGRIEHTKNQIDEIESRLQSSGDITTACMYDKIQTILVNQVVILQLLKSTP